MVYRTTLITRLTTSALLLAVLLLAFPSTPAAAQSGDCAAIARTETLQGQQIAFLTFGGTQLTVGDVPSDAPTVRIASGTAAGGVNVRRGPGTDFAIVGGLDAGQSVTIIGINPARDWLQIAFEDGAAWVFAELFTIDGNLDNLPVVETLDEAALNLPVRALTITPGNAGCAVSGLLIQTPPDGSLRVLVNMVDVVVRDTALFSALEDGTVQIMSLENDTRIESGDTIITLAAGQRTTVTAGGSPAEPVAYTYDFVTGLPLDQLPFSPQIAPPQGTQYGINAENECVFFNADGTPADISAAPAGEPLIISSGVRGNPDAINLFVNSAERTLTFAGETVAVWSVRGPFSESEDRIFYLWSWVIPDLAPGSYDLTLTTSGSDSNLDGEVICSLTVE